VPNSRVRFRLPGQMLAGAETHFEPDLRESVCLIEIPARGSALLGRQRQCRQKRFEQTGLPRAQLRPLAAAVMLAPERQVRTRL